MKVLFIVCDSSYDSLGLECSRGVRKATYQANDAVQEHLGRRT